MAKPHMPTMQRPKHCSQLYLLLAFMCSYHYLDVWQCVVIGMTVLLLDPPQIIGVSNPRILSQDAC
jgi:hypothetical protein